MTSRFSGTKFVWDNANDSNLFVVQETSTPRSMISDISNDTALSLLMWNQHASRSPFWFAGRTKKSAVGSAIEVTRMKQKGIRRRKTKAKHAPRVKRGFDREKTKLGEVNLAMLGSEDAASRSGAHSNTTLGEVDLAMPGSEDAASRSGAHSDTILREVNLAMLGSEDAASRSGAHSDKKILCGLRSRMTKRKVVDRDNTRRSEVDAQVSENPTCDELDETQVKMARCSIELEIGGGS